MKVKDMFTKEFTYEYGSLDVYDDICEELGVAFDGDIELTDIAKDKFAMVLDDDVEMQKALDIGGYTAYNAIVQIDKLGDGVWQKHLKLLKELFEGAAGYCAQENYGKWFKEFEYESN